MTKQQKQSELTKRMDALQIFEVMNQLHAELKNYSKNVLIKPCRYEVKMDLEEVLKVAEELEFHLNSVIWKSEEWEALE